MIHILKDANGHILKTSDGHIITDHTLAIDVTGTLNPAATGRYYQDVAHGGKATYRRADGAFVIWWLIGASLYVISPSIGSDTDSWIGTSSIEDDYAGFGAYTGTATATRVPPPL